MVTNDQNVVDIDFIELEESDLDKTRENSDVEVLSDYKEINLKNNDTLSILNKSRDIVLTSYNITSTANKIYNAILYKVQKTKNGSYKCRLQTKELVELIKNKDKRTLDDVKEILTVLKSTSLIFWNKEENKDVENDYNLIAGRKYIVEDDLFEIEVPDTVYNHLTKYKGYAPLNLDILSRFKSFYAQRMYELLRLWSRYNLEVEQKFSLEELRFVLGVEDKYPAYNNFKQKVLLTCQKELKEKANMDVEFIGVKTGRRTTHVIIKILDKERKRYFSYKKINELRLIDLSCLDKDIKNNIYNMINELEENLQDNNQKELNKKVMNIRNYIIKEKAKIYDNDIFKVLALFKDEDVTEDQAEELLKKSNYDFDKIAEVYTYAKAREKQGKIKTNIFSYIKGIIGPGEFIKVSDNNKAPKFNNFKQREYDYDALEEKLLGWDKDNEYQDKEVNAGNDTEESSIENQSEISDLKDFLRKQLIIIFGEVKYNTWLNFGVENISIINNRMVFLCPTEFNVQIIESNYIDILNELIKSKEQYKDFDIEIRLEQ